MLQRSETPLPASRQRALDLCLSGDGFGVLLEILTAERDALAVEVGESIARGDGVADGRSIQLAVDANADKAHRRARILTIALEELKRIQDKLKPVTAKFAPQIGEDFLKEFNAEIEKARAAK